MINDDFLLSSQLEMRVSENLLFDPLKIAKFFAKSTFRRKALEPRIQMRYFKFLLIDVHHNCLFLEGFQKIRKMRGPGPLGVV